MPEFVVTQGQKSISVLEDIKSFFGCGNIFVNRRYDNHREHIYRFCIRSLKDLDEKVIPFFNDNPLRTSKKHDFALFCEAVAMIKNGHHLTLEGLEKIRQLKNPQRLHAEPALKSEEDIVRTPMRIGESKVKDTLGVTF